MPIPQLPQLLKKVTQCVTATTLLAFAILVFVGIFDCANSIMSRQMTFGDMDHPMVDCIPGQNCGMDINKHIQIWQGMITTILPAGFFSIFATLLMVAFVLEIGKILFAPQTSSLTARYLYYERDHRENNLYNYFIHIFSSGILHAKLFA